MSKRKRASMENPMSGGEFAPPVERQFYSVAFLCSMLQQPPEFIHRLMRAGNIEFAYLDNGVGKIRGDDVQKMAECLEQAREVVEKTEAAPNN